MARKFMFSDIDMELTKQADGDITIDKDDAAIKNSVTNIINTMKGDRRMLSDFASDGHSFLFEPIDDITARSIGERFVDNLKYWDNRIEVLQFEIEPIYYKHRYNCLLEYKILATNEVVTIPFVVY